MAQRVRAQITGFVQGVGFRPFVYRLATALALRGYVKNSSTGVTLEVEGDRTGEFFLRLKTDLPPLARIEAIKLTECVPVGEKIFTILESAPADLDSTSAVVTPDIATCDDCLDELFDPDDRRYLYPFINCTNCGPRYSITRAVPYDRASTTMAGFTLCPACTSEYRDPENRRFHAEPNACPVCGPKLSLLNPDGSLRSSDSAKALEGTVASLRAGLIVAIKGIGGYHLACDATIEEAVARLRRLKRKSAKPFALMAPDLTAVVQFARVGEAESQLLLSNRRPIVLLEKLAASDLSIAPSVAPGNRKIGVMLPYAPLHHLLFRIGRGTAYPDTSATLSGRSLSVAETRRSPTCQSPNFLALVMTSGNLAEEPIVIDEVDAIAKLGTIADAILVHDRPIFMRVDDTVMRIGPRGEPLFIRRARGFVPEPILLDSDGPQVLAVGADLKNTSTLTKGRFAYVGQHIGDMENVETLSFAEETVANMRSVHGIEPEAVASDLHPGYASSAWADEMVGDRDSYKIQHHFAHCASVMAEYGIEDAVIGVAFDGTGYGTDGAIWGGEFLRLTPTHYVRCGHLGYLRLPGGDAAVREPWRMAVSGAVHCLGAEAFGILDTIGLVDRIGRAKVNAIIKMVYSPEFSVPTSSMGRLFDAASSICGLRDSASFEGEAAIALEAAIAGPRQPAYRFTIGDEDSFIVDPNQTLRAIFDDVIAHVPVGIIANRFHETVIAMIREGIQRMSLVSGITTVVVSGGVFQNAYLLDRIEEVCATDGYRLLYNRIVPANDGGISLGQAYIARNIMMNIKAAKNNKA